MSKCKNIIWKTLKFINVCITNFFVSCGILLMLMFLYSDNVKLDDLSIVAIFNSFIMYSSVYMVVYICKKLFFDNKCAIQNSSSDITEKEYPSEQKVKENACIHEAGHAVISILLGIKTVNKISTELFNKAEKMVDENRNLIYMIADELLKKEKLSESEVKQIIGNVK